MQNNTIIFMAASDTIAASLLPIIRQLETMGGSDYAICTPPLTTENAVKYFSDAGIAPISWRLIVSKLKISNQRPVLVLGNDWSPEARYLIKKIRCFDGVSVCIQESVVDFADRNLLRMRHADFAVLQGAASFIAAERQDAVVLGNPRYENNEFDFKKEDLVLVNCNFTYGVEEGKRDAWLESTTTALKKLNKKYLIIQHPRDNSDIRKFGPAEKTNVKVVNDYLRKSSLLITRYSSLLHESVSLGTPAIYYNPFNERMGYDFSHGSSGIVTIAYTDEQLFRLLEIHTMPSRQEWEAALEKYKEAHFRPHETPPSTLIAEFLTHLPAPNTTKSCERPSLIDEIKYFMWKGKRLAKIHVAKKKP